MLKMQVVHRGMHTSRRLLDKPTAIVDSIIRVDHAGELGADRIYAGQMAVLGNSKVGPVIKEMWDQEKHHKAKFEELIVKHRVRPTALTPFWNVAGFALGAGTALLGEKAAMACTVAVESVIVEHYNDQLRTLMAEPNTDAELLETIKKFRDEEQEHHDCGLDHGAEQAPFYQALTQVIKLGCRAAISMSKGLLAPQQSSLLIARHYSTHKLSHKNFHTARHHRKFASRSYSTSVKWDLISAVCLERKPVITKPLTPMERRYKAMQAEIELAGSHLSNHEIRLMEDKRQAEALKSSESLDADMEAALKQSGQDFEDAGTEELSKFNFAPREATADGHSPKRKLDEHLVLLTKTKLGNKERWILPQVSRNNGETMRETADRAVVEYFGQNLKLYVLGNAPFGFYKYNYPQVIRKDAMGAKIFMFKALYFGGSVELNTEKAVDFNWASQNEMIDLIANKDYCRSIFRFLIDDREPREEEKKEVRKVARA